MATKKITLSNEFHNTKINLQAKVVLCRGIKAVELSRHQVRRARRVLCGIPTCTCGGNLGERPSAQIMDGPRYDDGSATLVDEWVSIPS